MADDNKENECLLDSEINTLWTNLKIICVDTIKTWLERKQSWLYARKGVSKLVKADVIGGKAAASQFELWQTEKLVTPLGEKLPAPFSLVNWVKDLLQIPHFTEGDIYNYFV